METPLHRCMAKGMQKENDELSRSFSWVTAKKGVLELHSDSLGFRDWRIAYADIEDARLYSIWSILPGYVLQIKSNGRVYQFGLNAGKFWRGELPFPVEREKGAVKNTIYSELIRILIVAYVVYLIWSYSGK